MSGPILRVKMSSKLPSGKRRIADKALMAKFGILSPHFLSLASLASR